jgi:hypothetical protein
MSVPRHAIIQHESPETVCSPEVTCFEIELTPESASKSTPNQSDQGHCTIRKGGPFPHKINTNLTPFLDHDICHEGLQLL